MESRCVESTALGPPIGSGPKRRWSILKKLPERLEIIDVFQSVDEQKPKPIRYWCQDESRFGLKTLTHRVITALGIKPRGLVQWPFEALYAYGAVEPLTGESFFGSLVFAGICNYMIIM